MRDGELGGRALVVLIPFMTPFTTATPILLRYRTRVGTTACVPSFVYVCVCVCWSVLLTVESRRVLHSFWFPFF